MFAPDDTIVAVATPAGRGGIGVVRISGAQAPDIGNRLLSRRRALVPREATFARLAPVEDATSPAPLRDEVVVTWFPAPASYTGEHVVEISGHGSPVVLQAIVERAVSCGARRARPGEFTLRSFLNGKRDLVQAEAVVDLVDAVTPLQARVAFDQLEGTLTGRIRAIDALLFDLIARLEASLDFPDEGYHFVETGEVAREVRHVVDAIDALLGDANRGRMIREGATVVIVGRTNVGKSSVFNALAGSDRAIVTSVAGTTRDLITERVDVGGVLVTLVDTAGERHTLDVVEREGVARGVQARDIADLVLVVLDGSVPLEDGDRVVLESTTALTRLVVINKSDAGACPAAIDQGEGSTMVRVSARTGDGIDALRAHMAGMLCGGESLRESAAVTNSRHVDLLRQARCHLASVGASVAEAIVPPEEFVLSDLQAARGCLDEIVGVRTPDDVLRHIFDRFCIGK